ncbi:MAG: hypothetical protein MI923_03245 [Phycisphaerales bacterium]|nr:hypothetical protein [Phycisphaerales bacterium]
MLEIIKSSMLKSPVGNRKVTASPETRFWLREGRPDRSEPLRTTCWKPLAGLASLSNVTRLNRMPPALPKPAPRT